MTKATMPSTRSPVPRHVRECNHVDDHTWLYRCFDRDWELLYIGIAYDVHRRLTTHRARSAWWRFMTTVDVQFLPDRLAEETERVEIEIHKPLFNIAHARGSERSTVEYLARHEAWDLVDERLDIMRYGDDEDALLVIEVLGSPYPLTANVGAA